MYLQIIILAFILATNGVNSDGLTCKLEKENTVLECVLPTKYDKFDVSSRVEPAWLLDNLQRVHLFVGTTESPYEPPKNSSRIVYPQWNLMKQVNELSIQFNLKQEQEELYINLDNFQYISKDSFMGVNLIRLNVLSNNPEVAIEVSMLSSLSKLVKLWVEGASINAQGGWGNLPRISDLKLAGEQIGSMDLGWLPLRGLKYLDLSLREIKGVNRTIAKEMQQLQELSLTVSKTQTPDWSFIQLLVLRLHVLKLDGFALGDLSSVGGISENSAVRNLTLSHSPDTQLIKEYTFSSEDYIAIELSGMNNLYYIEELAFAGARNLINLTITDMSILTQITQPLGSGATPKFVQFTNSPKLSEISRYIFQEIRKYDKNILKSVDVRGTEMDSKCTCEASYLAAMHTKLDVSILSDCLDEWLNGTCKQDNCWTFVKQCNHSCHARSDPFSYRCSCKSKDRDLVLLPDGYTCGSSESCTYKSENIYYCSEYNADCHREEEYECICKFYELWNQAEELCVIDHLLPLNTTVHTKHTLIPLVTNTTTTITALPIVTNTTTTTITALPIVTNTTTTTITALPIVTNTTTTTITALPIVTNGTTKPWVPLVTNSTTISAHTLDPLVTTNVTGKTLHPQTNFVTGKTFRPGTQIITDMTLEPLVTNHTVTQISISTNKTTVSIIPIVPTTDNQGLHTPTKVFIAIAILIPLLAIIFIVLMAAFCCYRRKKGVQQRQYATGLRNSPSILVDI
ncbi:hypothetical protein LOD99_4204 [Oopsacas minuta]|uniref:Uncharacterized protein n=1 Tax=Oopsacas minuta TaxID=111878 RepID=A0AAV7JV55_9METZ|nr:hypothetical protein LOD99_4204 [Oopsacas minuta]